MNRLVFLGGVAGLGLTALLATGHAADHLDSSTLTTNPLGDLNDLYTWMTSDATKLNLVMTVSPADPGSRAFSAAVQYVFHVTSKAGTPSQVVAQPGGTETRVICTFVSNNSVQCWVVGAAGAVKDYVTGDPSVAGGLTSADGKLKVYAGRRSDPFSFNLQGFRDAIAAIHANAGALAFDAHGCPNNLPDTGALSIATLRGLLTTQRPTDATATPVCSSTEIDCFKTLDVLALVVQVDKTLVNEGANTNLGVWASTHAKP